MKKLLPIIPIIFMLCLCSCTLDTATNFDGNSIENGYNNNLAGGDMAYVDNNLYVNVVVEGYKTFGTYRFNNNGVSQVLKDISDTGDYALDRPRFYQYSDKIYSVKWDVLLYDIANDKLIQSEYDEPFEYVSDTLHVEFDYNKLIVKYMDNPEYIIEDVYEFYVADNIIYIINIDGWLYCNDVTKGNPKSEFLYYLDDISPDSLHVIGDNVYLNCDSGDNELKTKTGLYCYSVTDNSYKFILESEINCFNSFNGVLYIATEKGIYKYDSETIEKLTSRSATSIYLLDDKWIYAVQDKTGNIYRVSLDGQVTEKIDFMSNK